MKSIWTIMLNVLVRIGQLTQCATRVAKRTTQNMYRVAKSAAERLASRVSNRLDDRIANCVNKRSSKRESVFAYRAFSSSFATALKTVLVCSLSVAMLLPICITAETAVALDSANNSANNSTKSDPKSDSNSNSNNPDSNPDLSASSQSSALQSFDNSQGSVDSGNLLSRSFNPSAGSGAGVPFASPFASQFDSPFGSPFGSQPKSLFERAAEEERAKAQNRDAKNYSARESYEVYRPGCNKDYALGACITTDGDGAGLRATNGHDLDVNSLGYNLESSDQFASAATRPRGHYENGSVPEDPSGTDHYGATYFTPYPKGTFIMGRLRNMAFNYKGSGVDRINLPIDDTADFVFVKRTPKLSGGGFVWDIIFNAGGRTQGAGAALDYFTIPKGQILDKGSEGGRQYIQRVLYSGREATALYKKNQGNNNPPRETCSFSWDNPNGLCSIKTDGNDFDSGDDLVAAWNKMRGTDDSKNGNYSRILPDAGITETLLLLYLPLWK